MKLNFLRAVVVVTCLSGMIEARAQAPVAAPPPVYAAQTFSDAQLDQLLGPIALYPDPLIAQILPAATLPTQIVMADRYVSGGGDPNQIDQQPWDPSIQALARYPNVLKWMDDNLNWTTQLGQAFLNQQPDVMASIQRLRTSAYNLGNLQSTPQQQVVMDDSQIEIVPADPGQVYVPIYQPDQVYYDGPYGAPFITFSVGWPIGPWLNCDFDWHNHREVFWDRDHPRPADWWHERPHDRDYGHANVWRPENRSGRQVANRGDRGYDNRPTAYVPRSEPAHPENGHGGAPQHEDRGGNVQRPPVQEQHPQTGRPEERPEQHPVNVAPSAPVHVNPEPPHNTPPVNVARPAPSHVVIPEPSHNVPVNVAHPAPAPVQHYEPAQRPVSNGAFIGVQSPAETRNYSERGQQSIQTMPRSAPVPPSAPVSHSAPAQHSTPPSGGGGGGSHGKSH